MRLCCSRGLRGLTLITLIAGLIILMTQLLSLGLVRIKQPKVIAEVLGGILLGKYKSFMLNSGLY